MKAKTGQEGTGLWRLSAKHTFHAARNFSLALERQSQTAEFPDSLKMHPLGILAIT